MRRLTRPSSGERGREEGSGGHSPCLSTETRCIPRHYTTDASCVSCHSRPHPYHPTPRMTIALALRSSGTGSSVASASSRRPATFARRPSVAVRAGTFRSFRSICLRAPMRDCRLRLKFLFAHNMRGPPALLCPTPPARGLGRRAGGSPWSRNHRQAPRRAGCRSLRPELRQMIDGARTSATATWRPLVLPSSACRRRQGVAGSPPPPSSSSSSSLQSHDSRRRLDRDRLEEPRGHAQV